MCPFNVFFFFFFFGNHTGAGAVSNNALTEREEESANAGSYGYGTGQSECGEDKGGCEQICDDTSGRATCLCYRGYVVAQDGVSCTGFFWLVSFKLLDSLSRAHKRGESKRIRARVAIRHKNSTILQSYFSNKIKRKIRKKNLSWSHNRRGDKNINGLGRHP